MPTIRKVKSRTSTPARGTPAPADADLRKSRMQSSLDTWVEPALQNPTPTFEEQGLARHGVLNNMAALGVPPSSRVRQKARNLGETLAKSTVFGKKGAAYDDEDISTPEVTPAPEARPDESDPLDDDDDDEDVQVQFAEQEEEEDDDYRPKSHGKKKSKTAHGTKTPVRGKGPAQSKPASAVKSPAKNGITNNAAATAAAPAYPASGNNSTRPMNAEFLQSIEIAVNDAHHRSLKDGRPNVGIALRRMFNEGKTNQSLIWSLAGIIYRKESADDWATFHNYIKAAKKLIKRENKIKQAEEAARTWKSKQSPEPVQGDEMDVSSPAGGEGDQHPATLTEDAIIPSPVNSSTSARASRSNTGSPADVSDDAAFNDATPHPLTTAPAFQAAETSTQPTARMGSKSPRKQRATNGHTARSNGFDIGAEASTAAPTPAAKSPAGSDSGLSDVDEDILHSGPPPTAALTNDNAVGASSKKGKGATTRGGKKQQASRANSAKPPSRPKTSKNAPRTAEQKAEEARLQIRREELAQVQQERLGEHVSGYYHPTSSMRFDDDDNDETASMTESIAAMGPPGDINRTRGRARTSQRIGNTAQTAGVKRGRDISRFSSPHPDSAASSRPSTPAAASHLHPSKRTKLNDGQAARTKKSPVKNRDGPIAGIPHTGGGGSRQADDNDRFSPPSESDDLCSACKGAGEFVCCDTCPRVFHFLCCDPPQTEAPKGSFQCHVCSPKNHTEGVAAEAPLGPLFKALESTCTRSFTLPADIQDYFENVGARPDGSYYEDTKKIPLSKNSGYGYQKPDYTKLMDGNKLILCASCGLSSGGKRQMLKCDYCPTHWHLDCLGVPLANPPHINLLSSTRDAWRCPRHIEHDYREGNVLQNDIYEPQDTVMEDAPVERRGWKLRKPRNAQIVEPTFSRGMRNNGLIEIINDPDDETDGEGNYVFEREEKDGTICVYKVAEKGLIFDFISKAKAGRVEKAAKLAQKEAQRKSTMQHFAARPIEQQRAALNLAKLANKEKDIGLDENSVDALIYHLTAEAPNHVVEDMAAAPPASVDDKERDVLLKLKKLIDARLGTSESSTITN